jgi:hypothetical protein
MYLPACRISQTGVYGTGSRRQARIKGLLSSAAVEFDSGFWIEPVSLPVTGIPDIFELSSAVERSIGRRIRTPIFCYRSTKLVQDFFQTTIYRLKAGNAGSPQKVVINQYLAVFVPLRAVINERTS